MEFLVAALPDIAVDEEGFEAAMQAQRERSRGESIGLQLHTASTELPPSEFIGYDTEAADASLLVLLRDGEPPA